MSNDRIARWITIALILVGGVFLLLRQRPAPIWQPTRSASTPQDAIYAMLDAARGGDATAFLALYSGPMETSLRQAIKEQGEKGFQDYLRSSNSSIKGVALNEPNVLSDGLVEVRVEYVFQDRNEVQMMRLQKAGDAWKIIRVDSAERIKTLIPYGTPVQ